MLDTSILYHEFFMIRQHSQEIIPFFELPEKYHFTNYVAGDEVSWAKIEVSVGEFDSIDAAMLYFTKSFLPFSSQLADTMFFIENEAGIKIGTATAWYKIVDNKKIPLLHWVAIHPDFQGKGLANALISKVTFVMYELYGEQPFYLHTQTWSHKAVKLYTKFGYTIATEKEVLGESNEDAQLSIELMNRLGYSF